MRSTNSYLVFDFETTGLNSDADRIIQVGMCLVAKGMVANRFSWLINQDVGIPVEATRIHGISTTDIRTHGIPPRDSVERVLAAMRGAPTCIGHNTHRFDVPFLLAESRRLGVSAPDCEHFIDTAAIFKGRKLAMGRNQRKAPGRTPTESSPYSARATSSSRSFLFSLVGMASLLAGTRGPIAHELPAFGERRNESGGFNNRFGDAG